MYANYFLSIYNNTYHFILYLHPVKKGEVAQSVRASDS